MPKYFDHQNGRWFGSVPVHYYPSLTSPIAHDRFIQAIVSNCERIRHACGLNIYYAGETSRMPLPGAPGFIKGFLPQSVYNDVYGQYGDFMAYTRLDWGPSGVGGIWSAVNAYNPSRFNDIPSRSKEVALEGIDFHETCHGVGLDHNNDEHSVMNNEPYLLAHHQATPTRDDVIGLNVLYPPSNGIMRGVVSTFDFNTPVGNDPTRAQFYISAIDFENTQHSAQLEAVWGNGAWLLKILRRQEEFSGYFLVPEASIDMGKLLMRCKWRDQFLRITALQESDNSFEVVSIEPTN